MNGRNRSIAGKMAMRLLIWAVGMLALVLVADLMLRNRRR